MIGTQELPDVTYLGSLIVVVLIGLVGYLLDRRNKRIEKYTERIEGHASDAATIAQEINAAVNNHPAGDPKLYDIATSNGLATNVIDKKLDELRDVVMEGFARGDERMTQLDRRLNVIDEKVNRSL